MYSSGVLRHELTSLRPAVTELNRYFAVARLLEAARLSDPYIWFWRASSEVLYLESPVYLCTLFTVIAMLNQRQMSLASLLAATSRPKGSAQELSDLNDDDINIQIIADQLDKHSSRLFSPEPQGMVDFLDANETHSGEHREVPEHYGARLIVVAFKPSRIEGMAALNTRLLEPTHHPDHVPKCRYM